MHEDRFSHPHSSLLSKGIFSASASATESGALHDGANTLNGWEAMNDEGIDVRLESPLEQNAKLRQVVRRRVQGSIPLLEEELR